MKMEDKEMVRILTMIMMKKKKKEVSHLKAGMSGLAIMIASK